MPRIIAMTVVVNSKYLTVNRLAMVRRSSGARIKSANRIQAIKKINSAALIISLDLLWYRAYRLDGWVQNGVFRLALLD
jgi:hypothetical protein